MSHFLVTSPDIGFIATKYHACGSSNQRPGENAYSSSENICNDLFYMKADVL